ncbi:MAG: hypothetical protein H6Q78_1373 [Candidatus Krumholzibacteriota bacterium]|nr:hypothetical protein [Candidatus Krumholzibacteriota bacterium]
MRYRQFQRVALFVVVCGLAVYLGCAVPMPCSISPVSIEEIRSDIRDLDRDLADRKAALAKLEAEVAELDATLAGKLARIPLLQSELDSLTAASGRTEGTAVDSTATADSAATMTGSGSGS